MTDFEKAVMEMRYAQNEYFRTRDKESLNKAKQKEKIVDSMLEKIWLESQPTREQDDERDFGASMF